MVLAALYSGWIFYSRRQSAAEAERELEQKKADEERWVVEQYGGDQLKILSFGATPGVVSPGERVVLCYWVSNATQVKIEPGVEPVKPALSHCLDAYPKTTTTYKLTAENAKGDKKVAALTIRVQ